MKQYFYCFTNDYKENMAREREAGMSVRKLGAGSTVHQWERPSLSPPEKSMERPGHGSCLLEFPLIS